MTQPVRPGCLTPSCLTTELLGWPCLSREPRGHGGVSKTEGRTCVTLRAWSPARCDWHPASNRCMEGLSVWPEPRPVFTATRSLSFHVCLRAPGYCTGGEEGWPPAMPGREINAAAPAMLTGPPGALQGQTLPPHHCLGWTSLFVASSALPLLSIPGQAPQGPWTQGQQPGTWWTKA